MSFQYISKTPHMVRGDRCVERCHVAEHEAAHTRGRTHARQALAQGPDRKARPQGRRPTYGIVCRGTDGHLGYSSARSGDDPNGLSTLQALLVLAQHHAPEQEAEGYPIQIINEAAP